MKYIWEDWDIKSGVKVKNRDGLVYTIVVVDTKEECNAGFACYREDIHRVSPVYTAVGLAYLFTAEGVVPFNG